MSGFITNAELRIEAERLCDENERLEAENAELRKLSLDMLLNMGGWFSNINPLLVQEYRDRMSELGVQP